MIRHLAAGGLVALSTALAGACTATAAENDVPEHGAGACNAAPVQDLVGRPATQELGADALRRSGARALRWIGPGQIVTMDYRTDRLNIDLDGRGRVKALRCG